MKFRVVLIAILAILLSACSFSLAEDVTPPPGYVSPTPAPTLGPLYPAKAPSTQNGALIYADKCAACHGTTGMGDGQQGIQLGVTVPAFGLPDVARPAAPAQWYATVTQGNIERFMPPFASLSSQERWDVVAYAMSLHISQEQIAKGQQLFEADCPNCSTDFFKDQSKMAALSEVDLARLVKQGNAQVKPFGANLSDNDLWAVAAYLRSLSFDTSPIAAAPAASATPEAVTVTDTPAATEAVTVTGTLPPTEAGTPSTPSAEGTPTGTEQATAVAKPGVGNVSGSIVNKTGKDMPADLKVTLRGYDHGADPNTGPKEVFSQDAPVRADGSYAFENIEIPVNRIFIAEVSFGGTDLQSDFAIVKAGDTSVSLPAITLYNTTEDTSKLVIDQARILLQYGADGIQVYNVYSFRNTSEEAVHVKLDQKGEIPFIKAPAGSSGYGFQPTQDGEKLVQTKDGFQVPPSQGSYGLVTFATISKVKEFEFSQQFVFAVATVTFSVPDGVTIKGVQAQDLGLQALQDVQFRSYQLSSMAAGQNLKLTVSGTPKGTTSSTPAQVTSNQSLLIGFGVLGLALILAGGWMYLRERGRPEGVLGEEGAQAEFESAEDVMDAIIALDDLHRARKISDETYQKRRAELKQILKEKM